MRRKTKLVCGVGVNDAEYQVTISAVLNGRQKKIWRCPFYQTWARMLERCYSPKYHARRPTYIGCSVEQPWHVFSAFRAWMSTKDWEGKQLDKDILIPENKMYSRDTCAFVGANLNSFINDQGPSRGDFPIGVAWDDRYEKFQAQICNPFSGQHESLGYFISQDAAHEAWRKRKHQFACAYADMQNDVRIADALRTRYARND